eukprot:351893-Chlamydomonas_euryale.AAC.9
MPPREAAVWGGLLWKVGLHGRRSGRVHGRPHGRCHMRLTGLLLGLPGAWAAAWAPAACAGRAAACLTMRSNTQMAL